MSAGQDSPKLDIYSFGITLYEMPVGIRLYEVYPLWEYSDLEEQSNCGNINVEFPDDINLDKDIKDKVLKATSLTNGYKCMDEMIVDLGRCIRNISTTALATDIEKLYLTLLVSQCR